ncbi:hypothetical protein BFW01_g11432 [Lasiodiplodia theobromae]|uniref:uncharacterized protein n=1 Tax=Lasiodiplodia theobromae TaxID=45133 RepID=UPI0015C3DF8C|nr:uncharacterized protein LTHEOB_1595 [Lasiodiplodia theobromae]KAF4537404.1 hypothetical protein LTHEOB_1595 [Lasiodiplodia theobromae]KAF9639626.1 hypothetical protein BFW01_g11432 [Lasiodiplodia theobromae]
MSSSEPGIQNATMTEPALFVSQDDGDDVSPESRETRSAAGTEATITSSSGTMAISKSVGATVKKIESKEGSKRECDAGDGNGDADAKWYRNWGAGVRQPKPKIEKDAMIMGKKATSYTIPEMRRILQHFGLAAAIPIHPRKDDLLQTLVELEAEKEISAEDRRWILRQPLGPGGTLFQNLDTNGKPTIDSYPYKHAPKKRGKASNKSKPKAPPNKVVKPHQYSGSKSMPPSGQSYAAYSSISPSKPSGYMSKAEGKQPAKSEPMGWSAEQGMIMSMSMTVENSKKVKRLEQELAELKHNIEAESSTGVNAATGIEDVLGNESRERSHSPDLEEEHSEYSSSPHLAPRAHLPKMLEVSDSDSDGDSEDE